MWEIFEEVHDNVLSWISSGRTDTSRIDMAMTLTRAIGNASHKSMGDLSDALEDLKNADDSSWEDKYLVAQDKLAEAMTKFRH